MKVKNNSNYPRMVSGTRIDPGDAAEVDIESADELGRRLEEVEESGEASDQNTKDEKPVENDSGNGGE